MVILTTSRYHDLGVLAGDALDHPRAEVNVAGARCDWPVGVYLLGHRDPRSPHFTVDYVGSAVRRNGDISDRIKEHLRDAERRERFSNQVIFPLKIDTGEPDARRLEGKIARALGVPAWCRRVPGGTR